MKKTISAVLAVMMLAGAMTGCHKTEDDNGKETETSYESIQTTEKDDEKKTVAKYTKMVKTQEDGEQEITQYGYDGKGNLIVEIIKDSNGDLLYMYDYEYDNQGKITKEIMRKSDGIQYTDEYAYNEKGLMMISVYTDSSGRTSTTEYEYDNQDNVTKKVHTYSDGTQSITEYEYDDDGNCIKLFEVEYEYDDDGNRIERFWDEGLVEYEYDAKGNMIKEWKYYDGWSLIVDHAYDYDNEGVISKKHSTEAEYQFYQYEYDEKGNMTKKMILYPLDRQDVTVYEHDDKGNVIKEVHTNPVGSQEKTEYEYDDKGNVMIKVYTYADGDICTTKYEYEYQGNTVVNIKEDITITNGYHDETEHTYKYDEKGRIIKEVFLDYKMIEDEYHDEDNKVKESTYYFDGEEYVIHEIVEWDLDEQGRKYKGKVMYSEYVDENNMRYQDYYYENEYDEKGNLIREAGPAQYYAGMEEYRYEYNEHGDILKSVLNKSETTIEYNHKDGKEAKKVVTYSNGMQDITEWEYEYDDKGNLVKYREYQDGELKTTYEYFDYVDFDAADDAA